MDHSSLSPATVDEYVSLSCLSTKCVKLPFALRKFLKHALKIGPTGTVVSPN